MRLSDIMSHAGLAGYAEIALILFLAAFLGIVMRMLVRSHEAELEELRRLPFADAGDAAQDHATPHSGGSR